jgi:hypothetical protein
VSPVDALSHIPPTEDGRDGVDAPLTMDDLTSLINLLIQDLNREKYIGMILKLNQLNAEKSKQLLNARVVVDKAIEACSQLARRFKDLEGLVTVTPALLTQRVSRAASWD